MIITVKQFLDNGGKLTVPTCLYSNKEGTHLLGYVSRNQPPYNEQVNVLQSTEPTFTKLFPTDLVYIEYESSIS